VVVSECNSCIFLFWHTGEEIDESQPSLYPTVPITEPLFVQGNFKIALLVKLISGLALKCSSVSQPST